MFYYGKISFLSFISIILIGCGGGGEGSDNNREMGLKGAKSLYYADYTGGFSSLSSVSVEGSFYSNGLSFIIEGCVIHGIRDQYAVIYNNGFVFTEYKGNYENIDSVCNLKKVYRNVDVSDSENLDIAYMGGGRYFYDANEKLIYRLGSSISEASEAKIIAISGSGKTVLIKLVSGVTVSSNLELVYQEIDPSELGITLYKPKYEYFSGSSPYVMEVGFTGNESNSPYNMRSGYLYNYKDTGCLKSDKYGMYYEIYNDGFIYTESYDGSKFSSCYVSEFYKIGVAVDGVVNATYVYGDYFYDSDSKIYYKINSGSSYGGYVVKEILNDGLSAVLDDGEGKNITALLSQSYKRVYFD